MREHLDVGENPPERRDRVLLAGGRPRAPSRSTFRDSAGGEVISVRSDDEKLAAAKRPSARPGLNRFVWDLKYRGPVPLDPSPGKPKSLAAEPDAQSGPVAIPGEYEVALTAGDVTQSARFTIEPDPRLATTQEDYIRQFALLQDLTAALSRLNASVNRIRRYKRALGAAPEQLGDQAKAASAALEAVEGVLVDIHRASPRDVLRHPAGLNDTLVDLLNEVRHLRHARDHAARAGLTRHHRPGRCGDRQGRRDCGRRDRGP